MTQPISPRERAGQDSIARLAPDEQFFAWGWRVPFLLSIFLIAAGLFIRLRIVESPVFARIRHLRMESRAPVIEVLRDYPVAIILAMGVSFVIFVQTYIVSTFVPSYVTTQLGVPRGVVLTGLMLGSVTGFFGIIIAGALAGRVGTRSVALAGALMTCVLSFPFFWLIDTGSPLLIWIAMGLFTLGDYLINGVSGALTAEHFPARLRYSGISFSQQMAGLPGGALTPLIATALVSWSGGKSWAVAAYVAFAALVNFTAIYFASEKYRVSIQDVLTPAPQPQPA